MFDWACHFFNNYSVNTMSACYVPVTFLYIGGTVLKTIVKNTCLLGACILTVLRDPTQFFKGT